MRLQVSLVLGATTEQVSGGEEELASLRQQLNAAIQDYQAAQAKNAQLTREQERLRAAYHRLMEQHQLLRRRIFAAKAERVDGSQLELEFAELSAKLATIVEQLAETEADQAGDPDASADPESSGSDDDPSKKRRRKGRRNLSEMDLPVETVEIIDETLEGVVERVGVERSEQIAFRRGGAIRLVKLRVTYKTGDEMADTGHGADATFVTAPNPKEVLPRSIMAPSLVAHILVDKYRWGLPFHRQARMFEQMGVPLDDGMMCRAAEHVGATFGCVVDAMALESIQTAMCLSTDATGVMVQRPKCEGARHQSCHRGHFFVVLADQDHIFFEYKARHTSVAVCEMFHGYKGYIQADAHAVYDAVFRGDARAAPDDPPPKEVGCLAHARRKFFEAVTVARDRDSLEALVRIRKLFELEAQWAKLPPARRVLLRQRIAIPLLNELFTWAKTVNDRVGKTRGLVATAFGYLVRHEAAFRRYTEDGRLQISNNHSERQLRDPIATGRHAWLFFGSEDHATAAANLFSLIASCRLHGIDPETYFTDLLHVLPYWPRDRYLELAPKYWARTRARLIPKEIDREIGPITVPPPPGA